MNKLLAYLNGLTYIAKVLSDDSETQVGCALLSRKTQISTIIDVNRFINNATNYNLPTKRPNKYFYIQHAEANAIAQAASKGINTTNQIAIITHSPCLACMRTLWQAGINTIYFKHFRQETDLINFAGDLSAKLVKLKSGAYKLKLSTRK